MVKKSDTKAMEPAGKTAEDAAMQHLYIQSQKQVETAHKLVKKLSKLTDVEVSGGPFHYQIRAGTYGEQYDEAAWKLALGIEDSKERSGVEQNPMKCRYEPRVLVNNWVEERRDRQYIKYENPPRLSQYGYVYKSEYNRAYSKPECKKARDVLLNIRAFPLTAHPVHQPDMDIEVLRYSAPKPQSCLMDEEVEECRKEMETQKRFYKYSRELSGL